MAVAGTMVAAVATFLVGAAGLFAWANRATRRVQVLGPRDVEAALRCVFDDSQDHCAFDDFLAWPIDDPCLESIRVRCREIVRTSAPAKRGEDISQNGKEQIRELIRDLQTRT
jgi:hypothetical protein